MITRDNYEEFFLLYIDNELSMADRLAVEQWVTANPDLREEWESLLSCRALPEEELVFRDKKSLRRTTGDIDENNYNDYFLSYVDGELSSSDQDMVEYFIALFPSKGAELQQLRQTVSQPDAAVVFPDKNDLYRKGKDRRVVVLYRLVAGAAAAVLIFALLLLRGHSANEPVVVKNTPVFPDKKDTGPVTPATTAALYPTEDSETVRKEAEGRMVKENPGRRTPARRSLPDRSGEQPGPGQPGVGQPLAIANNGQAPGSSGSGTAPGSSVDRMEPEKQGTGTVDVAVVTSEHDPVRAGNLPLAVQQVSISKEHSSFATQALLQEDNEKEIATVSEPASPGKSKLRGFLRKVTRSFGKTADRDGDGKREVLISAFQVAVN